VIVYHWYCDSNRRVIISEKIMDLTDNLKNDYGRVYTKMIIRIHWSAHFVKNKLSFLR
jgi:hypothetical protein